jgi:predicted ABC-type ATPase
MAIRTPAEWAKANKKTFANKLIKSSGVEAKKHPSAIFMAGLPGAGKTEFTKRLIENSTLTVVRIDMDEIASQIDTYTPDRADKYRAAATTLLNEVFSRSMKRRMDFIMDGTFSSARALNNIKSALNRGYSVKVVYIHQDPKLAWNFTQAREKVEHRAIKFDGFIESYGKIINNVKGITGSEYTNVVLDIVIKNKDNTVGIWHENIKAQDIDSFVKVIYNESELRDYINE